VLELTSTRDPPLSLSRIPQRDHLSVKKWNKLAETSREVYLRHLDWLTDNFGGELLASFDRRIIKRIRNLPEFKNKTSVADAIIDRLGALWNFADADLDIELPGINPTTGIKPLHEEGDAAPAWPDELCAAFEAQSHKRMITFYMLARYTGQRRGDCCEMKWADFNQATGEMYVVQEKTGTRLWVPAPQRLLDHLRAIPRESDYILTSPKGGQYRATSVTNLICSITSDLGFTTIDSKDCATSAAQNSPTLAARHVKSWLCSATSPRSRRRDTPNRETVVGRRAMRSVCVIACMNAMSTRRRSQLHRT
jgi:integrase